MAGGADPVRHRRPLIAEDQELPADNALSGLLRDYLMEPRIVAGKFPIPRSKVTFDLYGHLMLGTEAEAAALLDRFLRTDIREAEATVRGAFTAA